MAGYVALAWGFFLFSAITILFRPVGERNDLVQRRISGLLDEKKRGVDLVDEELSKPLSERIFRPIIKSLSQKFEKLMPKDRKEKAGKNETMKRMLHQAGYSISVSEYSFLRIIAMLGTAAAAGAAALLLGFRSHAAFYALVGAFAGYVFMRFQMSMRITRRRSSMEEKLPDILDLLSVNVEAGLGFEQALLQVIGHFQGAIIDELTITYREMTMGRPRREALSLLGERCGLNEMKTFVGAMIQAEQLGISIKNVLRTQSASMRMNRKSKVQEKAMKISVKILLPMVGFIFPVLFIVLMGPAVVKVMNVFY